MIPGTCGLLAMQCILLMFMCITNKLPVDAEGTVFSMTEILKHGCLHFVRCGFNVIAFYKFFIFFSLCISGSLNFSNALDTPEALSSQGSLDNVLQKYAYRSLFHPKTGIIYDAQVPNNMSGIKVNAVRLRSGSLRSRGILYNEFDVPPGIVAKPYVRRLVIVYHNLGNWSSQYYSNSGFGFKLRFKLVAPVLGLLAYDYSNFSSGNIEEIEIYATKKPISISFTTAVFPRALTPMCISFHLNGTVSVSNVSSYPNICTTYNQGHFSLAVESVVPAPAPSPSTKPIQVSSFAPPPSKQVPGSIPDVASETPKKQKTSTLRAALGPFLGGFTVLGMMGLLVYWFIRRREMSMITKLEYQADKGEALQTALIGNSRAPVAPGVRTQPMLESENVT